jgi:beta-glucanase (GH16 family)
MKTRTLSLKTRTLSMKTRTNTGNRWHCVMLCMVVFQLATVQPGLLHAAEGDRLWVMVWNDEFDASEIDRSRWMFDIGTGKPLLNGWGNEELQYYTSRPRNARIENGRLVLEVHREPYAGMAYTSARIKTQGRADWTHGRFEIRARTPRGNGLWPAIWMLPTGPHHGPWPRSGEIDIMEIVGKAPSELHGTIHSGNAWNDTGYHTSVYRKPEGDFSEAFHTYAVEWEPGEIRWYVDELCYGRATPEDLAPYHWPFDAPFYLIMNVAVGGGWAGAPDETTVLPARLEIEYVRVYQRE